ncbi:unnamed protein product [Soboliphyme baturini]|uniref:UBR-type domain-containing protein n=1 Tax=Soboliphyme baturini TaxID=241478 RepID=A0A183IIW0_9BILA|nr:unnamed protein product [Soboliphyme baturini]
MTSLHFAAYPVPGGEQQFMKRMREVSNSMNTRGFTWPSCLSTIAGLDIKDIAIGPNHAAFLLEDGRVCRIALNIFADRFDTGKTSGKPVKTETSSNTRSPSSVTSGESSTSAPSTFSSRAAKIRRVMMARGRVGRGVIVGSRPLIPASAVPEELIAQAQVVLQGKSREVIIRELQKTNCDVNQAVNNLLSRDDDETEDFDDTGDSYLPEELISLLDTGLQGDQPSVIIDADAIYGDEVWGYSIRRRSGDGKSEKPAAEQPKDSTAQKNLNTLNPIALGGQLEFWETTVTIHSKSAKLLLTQERITGLATSSVRATLMTEKKKLASFVDDLLGESIADAGLLPCNQRVKMLERTKAKAKRHVSFDTNEITPGCQVRLRATPMYHSGAVGFTTVNGYPQVGVLMESAWTINETCRFRVVSHGSDLNSTLKELESIDDSPPLLSNSSSASNNVSSSANASAVTGVNTASSEVQATGSSGSGDSSDSRTPILLNLRRRVKRLAQMALKEEVVEKEEAWNLKDVVIIEENRSFTVGNVMMVDGPYCAVIFPEKHDRHVVDEQGDLMERCRLLRKEDLVVVYFSDVVSSGLLPALVSQVSKSAVLMSTSDCIQREPKKMPPVFIGTLIDFAVDSNGVWFLSQKDEKIMMSKFSLNGKPYYESVISEHPNSFLNFPCSSKPRIFNSGEESVMAVLDGNRCVFPLWKDSDCSIIVGHPWGLCPVGSVGIGIHPNKNSSDSSKCSKVAVLSFFIRPPKLMRHVLQCDFDCARQVIDQLAAEGNAEQIHDEIVKTRADGNRNILHMCAALSVPPSNLENVDTYVGAELSSVKASDCAAAAATRTLYDVKWDDMVNATRPRLRRLTASLLSNNLGMSVSEIMQFVGHPLRWSDSVSGSQSSTYQSRFELPLPPADWPMASASETAPSSSNDAVDMSVDVSSIPLPPPFPPMPCAVAETKERQENSIRLLRYLCEKSVLSSYVQELLVTKDQNGMTPFMYAISCRVYHVAILLWETIQRMAKFSQQFAEKATMAIFPPDSNLDNSPLFLLCYNDTCSFTWTGDEHINQDIFECRTCGLVGSLCCCTECANICHRNHDCKLKKTSPTAYCDCWEKCRCKALIAGNQAARFDLFNRVTMETDLVMKANEKGEHALLFLAKTVGRQASEQRQYRQSRAKVTQKAASGNDEASGSFQLLRMSSFPVLFVGGNMPEHDLDPPKFAKKALEKLLCYWPAVKAMALSGCKQINKSTPLSEDMFYLLSQNGVTFLDRFIYCLLVKCPSEQLEIFLTTMIKQIQLPEFSAEDRLVVQRCVRSVVRIYALLSIALSPGYGRKKRCLAAGACVHKCIFGICSVSQPVLKCRRIFQALLTYAVEELASAADAVMAPVRLGVLKCTQQFMPMSSFNEAIESIEKLLLADPLIASASKNETASSAVISNFADEMVSLSQEERRIIYDEVNLSDPDATSESDSDTEMEAGSKNTAVNQSSQSPGHEDSGQVTLYYSDNDSVASASQSGEVIDADGEYVDGADADADQQDAEDESEVSDSDDLEEEHLNESESELVRNNNNTSGGGSGGGVASSSSESNGWFKLLL